MCVLDLDPLNLRESKVSKYQISIARLRVRLQVGLILFSTEPVWSVGEPIDESIV